MPRHQPDKEQSSLAKAFKYHRGGIHLVGFPKVPILKKLMSALGSEALFKENSGVVERQRVVNPSFDPETVGKRQAFFRRLGTTRKGPNKTFIERGLPKVGDLRRYTTEQVFDLCDDILSLVQRARTELQPFQYLPEARRVLNRVNGFDSQLEEMLSTLKHVEEHSIFAIDGSTGSISALPEMPEGQPLFQGSGHSSFSSLIGNAQLRLKKAILDEARGVGFDLRQRVLAFAKDELRLDPRRANLRSDFAELAAPARIHSKYTSFLESTLEYDAERALCRLTTWGDKIAGKNRAYQKFLSEMIERGGPIVADPIYPTFSDHYDVRGLFPPRLMSEYTIPEPFIPINFRTTPRERKILFVGMHSGSKSFHLENLVLLSIINQLGEDLPGERIVVPKFDKIIYYSNPGAYGNNDGKCEREGRDIYGLIKESNERTLLVIDELFDSAANEIAETGTPYVLDRLMNDTDAFVIVASHRSHDYADLKQRGWTIMTPDWFEVDGEVCPAKTLKRGPPDPGANARYMGPRLRSIFEGKDPDDCFDDGEDY